MKPYVFHPRQDHRYVDVAPNTIELRQHIRKLNSSMKKFGQRFHLYGRGPMELHTTSWFGYDNGCPVDDAPVVVIYLQQRFWSNGAKRWMWRSIPASELNAQGILHVHAQ